MPFSLSPLPPRQFDHAAARHLLWRVGYGGTPQDIAHLVKLGLDAAVDHLMAYPPLDPAAAIPSHLDPNIIRIRTDEEKKRFKKARSEGDQATLDAARTMRIEARKVDRQMFEQLQQWWLQHMIATSRPFEERLTFFWHGHFATSQRSVGDAYLMYAQNHTMRQKGRGPFIDLLTAMIHDPAMLKYLNNDRNVVGKPNENLARELMELFTLGVGHYTEQDIKETARALTGHAVHDNDFQFRPRKHDDGDKNILGETGPFDGKTVALLLAQRPACAHFIALKLYDHFVADVGDVDNQVPDDHRPAIDAFAQILRDEQMRIGPALQRLFKSQHFYSSKIVGQKIKSPIQLVVNTVRSLSTPLRQMKHLLPALRKMGQLPFEPPSVDGWNSGRTWINTSTLLVRQNYIAYLTAGLAVTRKMKPGDVPYRPTALLAHLNNPTPQVAADALIDHALGSHVSAARRAPLHALAQTLLADGLHDEPLSHFIAALTATPEYQLC
ncbi:MAG: DUF1800 domain-containing protein [Algisphaera sp.]